MQSVAIVSSGDVFAVAPDRTQESVYALVRVQIEQEETVVTQWALWTRFRFPTNRSIHWTRL